MISFPFEYIFMAGGTNYSEGGHNIGGKIKNDLIIKLVTPINNAILDCYCIVQAKPEAKRGFQLFLLQVFFCQNAGGDSKLMYR